MRMPFLRLGRGRTSNATDEAVGVRRICAYGILGGVIAVLAVGTWFMLQRSDRMLDSNAVGVGSPIAEIKTGQLFCVNAVHLPAGTERLRLWLAPNEPGSTLQVALKADGRVDAISRPQVVSAPGNFQFLSLPGDRPWKVTVTDRICLIANGTVAVGGAFVSRLPGELPATLNGKRLGEPEPAVAYFSGAVDRPTQFGKLGDIFAHSTAFHGWAYPWLMGIAMLLAVGGTGFGFWLVATADRHRVRRLALAFMAIGFLWGAAWSFISPPFQGNDESEHFANVQYLAETGRTWSQSYLKNTRPGYSSRESRMLEAIHHRSVVVDGVARPFWNEQRGRQWLRHDHGLRSDDGGGYTISASGHGPLYYSLFAIPYRLTTWMQPSNQLVVLRLLNALLASFVSLLAVLTAAMLFAGRRMPSAVAGAVAAVQPMAAYSAASINNDSAVIVLTALVLYLVVKIATSGWTMRREVTLGAAAVAGPLAKLTGTTASLFAAAWIALIVLRDRSAAAFRGGITVAGTVFAGCAAWLLTTNAIGWPSRLANAHTDVGAPDPATVPSLLQRIDYTIQTIVPAIQITGDHQQVTQPFGRIYVVGGWADFAWHRISFPDPLYKVIAVLLAIVVLIGVAGLVRHRIWLRRNWMQVAIVLTLPMAVVAFVGWAYATPGGRPILAEQGRYILPALTALCVAGAGAFFGLPRRLRPFGWGLWCGLTGSFAVVCAIFASFHLYA